MSTLMPLLLLLLLSLLLLLLLLSAVAQEQSEASLFDCSETRPKQDKADRSNETWLDVKGRDENENQE